jgi:hypothetical protein
MSADCIKQANGVRREIRTLTEPDLSRRPLPIGVRARKAPPARVERARRSLGGRAP